MLVFAQTVTYSTWRQDVWSMWVLISDIWGHHIYTKICIFMHHWKDTPEPKRTRQWSCLFSRGQSIVHSEALSLAVYIIIMWPALPKPATYAHHVNEQFSPLMDSSINKLTNCQYTTAKCWQVCFCWGLFLRPVRRPRVLGCPLDATGRLVQATMHPAGNHHTTGWWYRPLI